jgi:hypothetical protein
MFARLRVPVQRQTPEVANTAASPRPRPPSLMHSPHRLDRIEVSMPIQRYDMTYGARFQDSGTDMHVLIHGKNDPDLGKGTVPKVTPNWWPTGNNPVATYFSSYMVQGHLLNQDLGGPGTTMDNLTPITRSTNTTHFTNIEKQVKQHVLNDDVVEYRVRPNYAVHPNINDLGNNPPQGVAPYLAFMAGEVGADYTVYHPQQFHVTGGLPGEKFIKNEGPQNKGTYI